MFLHNLSIATNKILHEFTNWKPYIFLIFFSLTFVSILAIFSIELFSNSQFLFSYEFFIVFYHLFIVYIFSCALIISLSAPFFGGKATEIIELQTLQNTSMTASGNAVRTSFYLYVCVSMPSLPCPQYSTRWSA